MSFEYPPRIRFECNRCGLCCGDTNYRVRTIALLKSEAQQISVVTKREIREFAQEMRGMQPYAYLMRKNEDGNCVFIKENRCTIYRIRPLVCEFYPFELLTDDKGLYVFRSSDECPNLGKGKILDRSHFERLFRHSSELINNTESQTT